jgi:hypothetical protein
MCDGIAFAGGLPPMMMNGVSNMQGPQEGGLQEVERVRSVFPETWLWQNVTVRCEDDIG